MPAPASRLSDTQAHEGSFPLSHSLAWHNGMHLQAPQAAGVSLPARAIADGTVVFVNPPRASNTTVTDAQNYNPFDRPGAAPTAAWTDNGCVIIEHTTTIGANGAAEIEVVFYSVYMHLGVLGKTTPAGRTARRDLQTGDPIWRRDEVGTPGQVYGHSGQIHFEVCLNADHLQHLIGRAPNWVEPSVAPAVPAAPTADGRTDSLFGSVYFYLLANTPMAASAAMPASHLRGAAAASTLGAALWVKMSYAAGDCTFETLDVRGVSVAALPAEADAEYGLYAEATRRHATLTPAQQAGSSPSGWYELLRFGRNIGRGPNAADKDDLPANAAHWRRIAGANGTALWADLNAPGSFKFSDADFLSVMGWNCIDDDTTPNDQRCDSDHLKSLIRDSDPANTHRMEATELARRLGNAQVQAKLKRAICKFPSEWSRDTAGVRYGFAEELMAFADDPQAIPRLQAHLQALSFTSLPAGYLAADWRMHPREFVRHLKKCSWLSRREMLQLVPNKIIRKPGSHSSNSLGVWESPNIAAAEQSLALRAIALNRSLRKFCINTPERHACFFLIRHQPQQAHSVSYLAFKIGGPNQEVRHVHERRAVSTRPVDAGLSAHVRQPRIV